MLFHFGQLPLLPCYNHSPGVLKLDSKPRMLPPCQSKILPLVVPSSLLLNTVHASSSRTFKFLPSAGRNFWSLRLMSPVDWSKNEETSCCIPAFDQESSCVLRHITSFNRFRNSDGDSKGPCLTAYKAGQFMVLRMALSIPLEIQSWYACNLSMWADLLASHFGSWRGKS